MKLFVVLFAFLAVQGWTLAGSINEDVDDFSCDITEFMHPFEISYHDFFGETYHEFTGIAARPEKCLPYIQDAYQIVIEVGGVVYKEQQLGQKLRDAMDRRMKQINNPNEIICYADLFKQTLPERKPITDAYLKIKPKVIVIMDKFDKCMDGKPEEVNSQSNPEKCLPYVQEAYDTAVEVRRISRQAHELDRKFYEGSMKCRAESDPDAKRTCLHYLLAETAIESLPIDNAYSQISPKIYELMDKFNNCLNN